MPTLPEWPEFAEERFKDISIASFAGEDKWADNFMRVRYTDLKINQLRNFFGEIQKIQNDSLIWENEQKSEDALSMIGMNLAYDYGRNVITQDFYSIISASLKKIKNKEDFERFVLFVKSMIAYHKYHSK